MTTIKLRARLARPWLRGQLQGLPSPSPKIRELINQFSAGTENPFAKIMASQW